MGGGLRGWRRTSAEGRGLRAARDHWVPGVAAARSDPAPPLWTRRRLAMAAEAQLHARFPERAAAEHELGPAAMPLNFFEPVGQLIDPDESAESQGRKRLGPAAASAPAPDGGGVCAKSGRGLWGRSPSCLWGRAPRLGSERGCSARDRDLGNIYSFNIH